ncbi:transglycosylase SLT domain-containing protein [Luteibacter yeojuensis]|uniref:Transglycosylase SLT domain-containing protein n=1 Tax=Luteibacter yeojuensis TaxID=345309 RepID=A0A7X5QTI7_9GAMM|nr:transglycosylase SLT domain-containing protein [Luteibacter yeojuensis]NID15157.1 transglycosylase SLT domain-containing protein [Luteibacter yeojuensis]
MNVFNRRLLPTLIPLFLTACAGGAPKPVPQQPVATVTPVAPVDDVAVAPKLLRPAQPADFWAGMRESFAMPGCEADPKVLAWARTYTRSPNRFEQHVNEVLPLIVYAHKSAMKHSVAGEFALLPWVESQYRHVPGHKNRPAGMWQIMPQTARTLGLRVEKNYDERLDIAKSTESVMTMMRRYYDDLGDWRLVDVAYNAGEFGLKKKLDRHGGPTNDDGLPDVPMKAVTRDHLVKLMAIACIVRDPARFNVSLPKRDAENALQVVQVSNPQSLAQAAKQSGLSMDDLRDFNPAYRTNKGTVSSSLLLPKSAADQYKLGPVASSTDAADAVAASVPAATQASGKAKKSTAKDERRIVFYKVNSGESLWSIARRHQVSVEQLMTWNDLQTKTVQPGQVLKLSASR